MGGSRGMEQGVRTPLKNHKIIGFLSNTGPDPLKPSQYSMLSHQPHASWRADDDPLRVVFRYSLPIKQKTKTKKKRQIWASLTKLSGSAHAF